MNTIFSKFLLQTVCFQICTVCVNIKNIAVQKMYSISMTKQYQLRVRYVDASDQRKITGFICKN